MRIFIILTIAAVLSACGHRQVSDKPWTLKNISDAIDAAK